MKRLVEAAIAEVCGLPRPGLWLCLDEVEAFGSPPERIRAWATLHFTAEGSPFCCGEPQCHLGLFGERLVKVEEHVRHAMQLRQTMVVEFGDILAQYHAGVAFHSGQLDPDAIESGHYP